MGNCFPKSFNNSKLTVLLSEYLIKCKLFGARLHYQDDDTIGSGRDLTMAVMFFQWLSLRWY